MRIQVQRIALCALQALLLIPGVPGTVGAHAVLVDSVPKDAAVLAAPPREVILRFNARIEQRVARVVLLDGRGRRVALPPAAPERDGAPSARLVIPLPLLGPGSYRLQYRILATDGHATPGQMSFTVTGRGAP